MLGVGDIKFSPKTSNKNDDESDLMTDSQDDVFLSVSSQAENN